MDFLDDSSVLLLNHFAVIKQRRRVHIATAAFKLDNEMKGLRKERNESYEIKQQSCAVVKHIQPHRQDPVPHSSTPPKYRWREEGRRSGREERGEEREEGGERSKEGGERR